MPAPVRSAAVPATAARLEAGEARYRTFRACARQEKSRQSRYALCSVGAARYMGHAKEVEGWFEQRNIVTVASRATTV